MKIAYIGLGHIGAPCARLIAAEGFALAVYDPSPAALQAFEGRARLGQSVADAATGADVACVCVRDDRQVREVVLGPDGLVNALGAGSVILVHSTVSIELLGELESALAGSGILVLDAPVSRTRATEDEKFVFTMLGGAKAGVAQALPVIEAFSTDIEHMGPLGAGMATKIANNLVTWAQLVIGSQAVALAAHHGVAFEKIRRVMESNGNLTPAVAQTLDGKAGLGPAPTAEALAGMDALGGIGEKDLMLAIASGERFGMDMGVAREVQRVVRAVMTSKLARPAG